LQPLSHSPRFPDERSVAKSHMSDEQRSDRARDPAGRLAIVTPPGKKRPPGNLVKPGGLSSDQGLNGYGTFSTKSELFGLRVIGGAPIAEGVQEPAPFPAGRMIEAGVGGVNRKAGFSRVSARFRGLAAGYGASRKIAGRVAETSASIAFIGPSFSPVSTFVT
jgi:hypothetical protein